MDFPAQMYWVFGVRPSQLDKFFWTVTLEDFRTGTEVKLGELCAVGAEMTSSLIMVIDDTLRAVFGDSNKGASAKADKTVSTKEDFIKAFDELVTPE